MQFLQAILVFGVLTVMIMLYLPQIGVEASWGEILATLIVSKAVSMFLLPAPVVSISARGESKTKEEEEK